MGCARRPSRPAIALSGSELADSQKWGLEVGTKSAAQTPTSWLCPLDRVPSVPSSCSSPESSFSLTHRVAVREETTVNGMYLMHKAFKK